ncbi:MAG: hypothetical protein ACOY40_16460 [Bacillota bacterium]
MDYPRVTGRKEIQGGSRKERKRASGVYVFLVIVVWVGIVFGGFYLAKQYIDQSIQSVQQTNAMQVQTLEARLDALAKEMKEIEETLENAGVALSSSDTTQKKLDDKIEKLDKQLQELEKSLKILKEAP